MNAEQDGLFVTREAASYRIFEGHEWTPLPSRQVLNVVSDDKPAGLLESENPEIHSLDTPEYIPFHVVLDSGAADHVVNVSATPGHQIEESPGSRAGACFVAANGERIPNRGQVNLRLRSGRTPIKSTFQVSRISKPLWSVGKLCDAGFKVNFDKSEAIIIQSSTGKEVGKFPRSHGLYIGEMELKMPEPAQDFQRQA